MNLQQLLTFSTVISEGSMTAAAAKLYLTQPAVSQQIRNLEEELGVDLLVRGTRQARPTVQGQLLYDYAKRIISLTQQAQAAIQTIGDGVTGTLRVGTLNSLGLYLLSSLVGTFLRHNSKVNISLFYDDGKNVMAALGRGELDVAILPDISVEYGLPLTGLESRPLFKDEMMLIAPSKEAGLPAAITLKELVSRPFVKFTERHSGFDDFFRTELTRQNIKLKAAFESNNVGTVKKVIESGFGWGFLPAHSIRKQVRAGRMNHIEVTDLRREISINYYNRKPDTNAQITEMFYRAVRQPV